jgi:exodeoxyribonuclease V gamma subunit
MRELEVLHDRLLALFEQDPTLTPKDVVVMMPDVNSYGPYIQAVFGKEGGKGRAGPAARSPLRSPIGRRARRARCCKVSRPAQAAERPLRGGELLAILEVPAVLRRFELDDDEFNVLRRWVQETGIRWGLDDDYPERFALPRLSGNSWLFGLRRMLLGFAMGTGSRWRGSCPMRTSRGSRG